MSNKDLTAMMVWAIDRDLLSMPFERCWELFQRDAVGCQEIYTDPSDELLFCKNVVEMNSIEFFTDYVLFYAKSRVISGITNYGNYNNSILNYNKL